MKSAKTMTMMMAILFICMTAILGAQEEKSTSSKSDLKVLYSPGLESLAIQLASDYMDVNRDIRLQVDPLDDQEIYEKLEDGSIALLSKECIAGLEGDQYFKMVVGRDAIVPVMNSRHPHKDLILEKGISPEVFARIFTSAGNLTWGEVLGLPDRHTVQAYIPGASSAMEYLTGFLHTQPGNLSATPLMDPGELLNKIAANPSAIGFCSLDCLMQMEKTGMDVDIALVPVDMDGDGRIGTFEEIYQSSSMLSHAIFVGRFPRALYSPIYAVTNEQPAGAGEMAFLEWMISGGQETLASAGILELGFGERNSRMEELLGHDLAIANVQVKASPARVYLLVAGLFLLLGLLVFVVSRFARNRIQASALTGPQGVAAGAFPGGLFFDRSHTWAFMEKSGRVRIGIDNFLQDVCGPVTRVQMKQPGEQIRRGEAFLTLIQNGKRLEIKAPLSGVIKEQNEELIEDASLLNNDPYATGWVMMVEPASWITDLKSYFIGSLYTDWLKTETTRLKEFFTSKLKLDETKEAALVLQDGGEINSGVLEAFGPEMWEEFQEGFINKAK
jgi:glycine cleavage system H lipoate-binding protein/ABC-type phosphate transport system substrate-binding protein